MYSYTLEFKVTNDCHKTYFSFRTSRIKVSLFYGIIINIYYMTQNSPQCVRVVSRCPLKGSQGKLVRRAGFKTSSFFASKGGSTTPRVAHRGCPGWRSSKKLAPPIGLLSPNHSQAQTILPYFTLSAMPGLSLSMVCPC